MHFFRERRIEREVSSRLCEPREETSQIGASLLQIEQDKTA
jgi:hypothetical protein